MAKRRAIGRALSRGGQSISELADAMYRAKIQEESQARLFAQQDRLEEARNQNIAARQTELAKLQDKQRRDQYLLENPAAALPGPTRMAQGVGEGIDKADDVTKLPTRMGVAQSMGGGAQPFPMPFGGVAQIPGPQNRPEISQLLQQRQQKEAALVAELQRKRKEQEDAKLRIDPETGVAGFLDEAGTHIQTERTGPQQGQRDATIEKTTRPGAISRAAGVEAGQTGARINTEAANLDKIKAIAEAKHVSDASDGAGGRLEAGKRALANFKALSEKINVYEGLEQATYGAKRKIGALTNQDNDAILFDKTQRPLAMQLTVLIQGSRPTDTDVLIQRDLIPGFTTPKTVAKALIAAAEDMITHNEPGTISREDMIAILEAAKNGTIEKRGRR